MDPKRILLVEDDLLLQKLYLDLLNGEKFNVDLATDGEEAYEKMKQGGFDLVLLDIMLPKMSGTDVMKKLQTEHPINPNKKIIFLTNLDKGKNIDDAKQMGNEYLVKSDLTPDQFINKVKSFL